MFSPDSGYGINWRFSVDQHIHILGDVLVNVFNVVEGLGFVPMLLVVFAHRWPRLLSVLGSRTQL